LFNPLYDLIYYFLARLFSCEHPTDAQFVGVYGHALIVDIELEKEMVNQQANHRIVHQHRL
jgi:hypothetical protein